MWCPVCRAREIIEDRCYKDRWRLDIVEVTVSRYMVFILVGTMRCYLYSSSLKIHFAGSECRSIVSRRYKN